jgi:hypothetical protein
MILKEWMALLVRKICPGSYLFGERDLHIFHKYAVTWIAPFFVDDSLQYFTDAFRHFSEPSIICQYFTIFADTFQYLPKFTDTFQYLQISCDILRSQEVAREAQWLERRAQRSDDPSVGGSNPTVGRACRINRDPVSQ